MESLHSLDMFAMVSNKILGISYDAVENPNRGKVQQEKKRGGGVFGWQVF
jgi:hypothetical protein